MEKINKKKEDIQINIRKIFSKIRIELNKVEFDFLNELENRYEKLNIFKKIKDNWILLNKIKLVLNTGNINNSLINECKNYDIKNEANKNYDKELDIEIPQEEDINKILEKINNLLIIINCIFDSSIIKNDYKKQNIINSWIKEKMNKNIIKYELIYQMSENGSRPDDFHEFCDNKGPTLTIIETKNNYIFGGFTPLNWSTNNKDSYDQSKRTFIFSLNLMKNMKCLIQRKELYSAMLIMVHLLEIIALMDIIILVIVILI